MASVIESRDFTNNEINRAQLAGEQFGAGSDKKENNSDLSVIEIFEGGENEL